MAASVISSFKAVHPPVFVFHYPTSLSISAYHTNLNVPEGSTDFRVRCVVTFICVLNAVFAWSLLPRGCKLAFYECTTQEETAFDLLGKRFMFLRFGRHDCFPGAYEP